MGDTGATVHLLGAAELDIGVLAAAAGDGAVLEAETAGARALREDPRFCAGVSLAHHDDDEDSDECEDEDEEEEVDEEEVERVVAAARARTAPWTRREAAELLGGLADALAAACCGRLLECFAAAWSVADTARFVWRDVAGGDLTAYLVLLDARPNSAKTGATAEPFRSIFSRRATLQQEQQNKEEE